MGVDTHLYLSNRWTLEDVIEVINSQVCPETPVTAKPSEHCASFGNLGTRNLWFSSYHLDAETPLGRFIMLSAGYSLSTVQKFKQIAEALGGALEEQDCDGKIEFITGRLSDGDRLSYFLKYAVIHGHSGEADKEGIVSLVQSINDWQERYSRSSERLKICD